MAEKPFQRIRRFLRELKRRNVYKVAVAYLAVAFVGIQAAQLLVPPTTLPGWADDLLIYLAVFGFPIALVIAWAFEMTPKGVRRTRVAERAEEGATEPGKGLSTGYRVFVGLGLLAAAVAGGWYLTGSGGGEPTARLGDRSIAVLPFEALGQEEPGTFTEGMHDDLLARLSNISDLRVISRTAVQQYRNSDNTTGEIARELGVRWVLEGAVQEMGDQIQVNAQLIDPRTETHAWVETYQRDLTAQDLFDLQGEITRRIVRSLEAQLTADEVERIERRPTKDLAAYRLYVQGRSYLDTRTGPGMRQAAEYFQRAIAQDSGYALAWAGLADARTLLAFYGYGPADSLYRRARETAHRALELDSDLSEAHASLGHIELSQRRDLAAALHRLRRAVELKPSAATAHQWLGEALATAGQLEAGVRHLERSVDLDPLAASHRVPLGGSTTSPANLGRHSSSFVAPSRSSRLSGWRFLVKRRRCRPWGGRRTP